MKVYKAEVSGASRNTYSKKVRDEEREVKWIPFCVTYPAEAWLCGKFGTWPRSFFAFFFIRKRPIDDWKCKKN